MSRHVFKLPDLGEGTVQAEIVGWRVKPGDVVAEDDVIVEVMTDKAAVEVPAPVSGRVLSTTGNPGDSVPVGAELIVFETDVAAAQAIPRPSTTSHSGAVPPVAAAPLARVPPTAAKSAATSQRSSRVATSPALRRRAHEAGVDLATVPGSGPNGRIVKEDLDAFVARRQTGAAASRASTSDASATEEIKVIGVRRLIAQKMSEAKRNIPHFAYVEEIDVTELESLRRYLNEGRKAGTLPGAGGGAASVGAAGAVAVTAAPPALTYLPLLVLALARVLADFPQCNATYDAERGVIVRHRAVHVGVATQTPDGLKVPVVRNAQSLSLWSLAAEMKRVSEAARASSARRDELTGSTITVTSLGKLGGIASTPIINAPEVSIIGVNRAVERPVVLGGAIVIRRMMNLSSSFDHRFVDGYDAAAMIQALKERLEHPATIFMAG